MAKVACVLVAYQPEQDVLVQLVHKALLQSEHVFLIDNTPSRLSDYSGSISAIHFEREQRVTIIANQKNLGIAAAQNIGLRLALENAYDYALLLDQDSTPGDDLVDSLSALMNQSDTFDKPVAAIGPVIYDPRSQQSAPFIQCDRRVRKVEPSLMKGDAACCDFLVASGSLISLSALKNIGFMDDDLFIDCVDLEWGFRARSKGYQLLGARDIKMHHTIGDEHLSVFGRKLTMHSPLRHYYFFRNFYHLLKKPYVPFSWKLHVFFKSSLQAAIYSTVPERRFEHCKMIFKGIWHGIIGKLGKYQE
ncbi:MAG: glycosyltransferase family 2 protein [Cellvibrionaceae bacterium]